MSYIESEKAAAQFGFYQQAEWKPDDSMIAVAVSGTLNHLIFFFFFSLAVPLCVISVCIHISTLCLYNRLRLSLLAALTNVCLLLCKFFFYCGVVKMRSGV